MYEAIKLVPMLKKHEPMIDQLRKNAGDLSDCGAVASQISKIISEYDELMVSFTASDIYMGKLVDRANEILESKNPGQEVALRVILNETAIELEKCEVKFRDFSNNLSLASEVFIKTLGELLASVI